MHTVKPRLSFDPDFHYNYHKFQDLHQPSFETQKLIEHLQGQQNLNLQDKLRGQIFYKPVNKIGTQNQFIKKIFSPNKFTTFQKQKYLNNSNPTFFDSKLIPKQRKGFFSPKIAKKHNQNCETSNSIQHSIQLQKENFSFIKTPFSPQRKISNFNRQLVRPEVEVPFIKSTKQCPQFLRKGTKTTKNVQPFSRQKKIKIQDFIILKNLGQGTFGQVFEAFHKYTGSLYTIKMYKKEIIKTHQLQDKFIHDIKMQLKMNHPNIVKLYGFFDDATNFYMIFQFMQSGNLSKIIEQKGSRLSQSQIYRKVFEINDALLYLHDQNLIHRDIKPASVLTCLDVCKLCDTEWLQQNTNVSHHITLCKQLDYTAPQALEGKQITSQFDMWGLGMIAYQLLTGKKLIEGTTKKMLIRKIINLKKQLVQILIPTKCTQNLRQFIISALDPISSRRLNSSEINQMKRQKQKQLASNFLANKNIFLPQKNCSVSQKIITTCKGGSPKNGYIYGVKKQIRNQVSTLL